VNCCLFTRTFGWFDSIFGGAGQSGGVRLFATLQNKYENKQKPKAQ
jgi:hypothetical protein